MYQSKQFGVEFTCQHASDVSSGNMEQWARTSRYQFFSDQLTAGGLLLLAHHQDDQAETLLLNLIRGAGPAGLAGIAEIRPFAGLRAIAQVTVDQVPLDF